ncbi:hypothetical protein PV08_07996 [Exophiala spinifera]|uniref:Bacteriophage T5 Orf172 DNA-binding domain-containing protein n=1 Tax=Exophiala spinifera TaxID=91928 RepID=A0A0D2BNW5_9EURO|nr:uncharacterized protein PV08_07996 [Exophiala spinifera]KIW12809.1 hypothetical protein PV08_07996 [Exophiala spinifera]
MAHSAYHPGVSFFINFYNLDPSSNDQCIFYTQKGTRCKWPCSDIGQAITLRGAIIAAASDGLPSLDLLEDYVLSNCCMTSKARHRRRIEDFDLLTPLALRWQDEIRTHAAGRFNHAPPVPPIPRQSTASYPVTGSTLYAQVTYPTSFGDSTTPSGPAVNPYSSPTPSVPALVSSIPIPATSTTPLPSTPNHLTTHYAPGGGTFYYQANAPMPYGVAPAPSAPVMSSQTYRYSSTIPSAPAPGNSVSIQPAYSTPFPSTPDHPTTNYAPTNTPLHYQANHPTSFGLEATPSVTGASLSPYQEGSPRSPITTKMASLDLGSRPQPRDVRSPEVNTSARSTSVGPTSVSQSPLSEFRIHITKPLRGHSVSRKLLDPLEKRDFETGSLYIFARDSSPGYVKIGWTADTVQKRLDRWSESCGYTPNLLFEVNCVPYAQRAETLTHHELINEWRWEKCCPRCQKPHIEWFETTRERAEQVLRNWADFMIKAEPYSSEGTLKNHWRKVMETMERNGEKVTGKALLDHYEASLVGEAPDAEDPVELEHTPKVDSGGMPKVRRQEPLPSSLQSSALPPNAISSQEKILTLSAGTEEATATPTSPGSDTNPTVVGASSQLEIDSLSRPAESLVTADQGNSQPNTHTSTDASTEANSPRPSFSGPPAVNISGLSAISTSPGRKAEQLSDPRAPLVMVILQDLLSLNIDELEEAAETLASIIQRRQNAEKEGQGESESKLLGYNGENRMKEGEEEEVVEELESHDEEEAGAGSNEEDADETLVEDQIQLFSEKEAAVKIADGLCKEFSPGEATEDPKALDPNFKKVLDSETPPAVGAVALA